MPQNTTIECAPRVWTLLTNNDVDALRAANLGSEAIWLQGTVGTTPPTSAAGGLPLLPGQILPASALLVDVFPGVAGVNRVYALTQVATRVSVSHA